MSKAYSVECTGCSYARVLRNGHGSHHQLLDDAIEELLEKNCERFKKSVAECEVLDGNQGYEIPACERCQLLFDRYQIQATFKAKHSEVQYAFASFLVASALSSTRSLRLISLSELFMVIVLRASQITRDVPRVRTFLQRIRSQPGDHRIRLKNLWFRYPEQQYA